MTALQSLSSRGSFSIPYVLDAAPTASTEERAALLKAAGDLRSVIRGYQEEIEQKQRIPTVLVEQLRTAGLYRMVVPRALGGLQVDLLTFFRAVELVSEGDGSVGWNLANHAIATFMALSLPDEGITELFGKGPDYMGAGTILPTGGRAVRVDGGYVVTGRWSFGSGCDESEWMVGGFEVVEDDQPLRTADGFPVVMRGFFKASECSIIERWDVTGLRGTGSHDWSVTEVFVPERRTVSLAGGSPLANRWSRWGGTLYELPQVAMGGAHHSAVATGIARAGIDALTELAGCKVPRSPQAPTSLLRERPQVQEWVGRAEALLEAARAFRTTVTTDIWETVAAGHHPVLEQLARCHLAASYAVDSAMQAVDLMWRAGGTTSIERSHRLARCWRDVHVVGQAITVTPEWYPLAGRAFLGLDPGPRLS
jgi:indole-3-acetate monooxygenase